MPPKRTRAAASKTSQISQTSSAPVSLGGKKLKIVLSSSSSGGASHKASHEKISLSPHSSKREAEDELDLSEEEEDLDLESSPVKPSSPRKASAGRIQLKLSLSKSPEPSSEDEIELEEDVLESDGLEEEVEFDEDSLEEAEEVIPQKMTRRQQAMLDYNYGYEGEVAPVSKLKEKEEITEEEALRRAEKTRRRQAQRDLKMEESKQATINRLLQKHGARSKKMKASQQTNKADGDDAESPSLSAAPSNSAIVSFRDAPVPEKGTRFKSSSQGSVLVITDNDAFDQVFAPPLSYPRPTRCAVSGCQGAKKYTEPQSCKPVCSLDCYRKIVS